MTGLIKTEEEYEDALERVHALAQLDWANDASILNEMEFLGILIAEYEAKHYPMEDSLPKNPIEAIKNRLQQLSFNESELVEIFGSYNRQFEILSGKRKLSLSLIRKLHEKLNIPAETLIAAY